MILLVWIIGAVCTYLVCSNLGSTTKKEEVVFGIVVAALWPLALFFYVTSIVLYVSIATVVTILRTSLSREKTLTSKKERNL